MEDIVNFRPLRPKRKFSKLSQEVVKKIAADQQYLFRIVTAVINGSGQFKEDKSHAKTSPGKYHNAGWLTLANRILPLWCNTKGHDQELERIVMFLIDVYPHCWFDIVENPGFLEGPRVFQRLLVSLDAFPFRPNKLEEMACINRNRHFFVHFS